MTTKLLTQANLEALVSDLLSSGTRVVAPARSPSAPDRVDYRPIAKPDELALNGALPSRSLKEFFLPPTEALLRWRKVKQDVTLEEVPTSFDQQVILGARPCDAAAIEILDKVMGWDFRDELWFGRREATTIVSVACPGVDKSCFCSAVGLGPDARRGSDVLLVPCEGGFLAEAVSSEGEAFLLVHAARLTEGDTSQAATFRGKARAKVEANLKSDPAKLSGWLAANFDHAYWKSLALRCHGCGACASVCPTCHCFDIVDEPAGVEHGVRRRNWDTCQTAKFTVHASGHNPRAGQNERFRQRVMHKFSIYPKRFSEVLCTGCGRCARACPAGMDLPEVLGQLAGLAQGGQS